MNSKLTREEQARDFLNRLFKRCWENPDLKKALVQDPIGTLEALTGKAHQLPPGYRIQIEDQSNPNTIFINIPPKPN
ncbi:MAG: hypothetical protein AB3N16_14965 [Flavobacteriaceae bacterium]